MSKKKKKAENNTFQAKVDIVTDPNHIRNYSSERKDYTELALVAINNKPKIIKFISSNYKDYAYLCEEAIKEDVNVFPFISDTINNYKNIGTKAIVKNPYLVSYVKKSSDYYLFFWKLAISICYKILQLIDEDRKELYPLIEESIKQEPKAILFVNNELPIYGDLCRIAHTINQDSASYMDINKVDKEILLSSLRKNPDNIRYLDHESEFYLDGWKTALQIDGSLIRYLDWDFIDKKKEEYFELLSLAAESNHEVADYPSVINSFRIYNRKLKASLEKSKNYLGNNLYKLLRDLDIEYDKLTKDLIAAEQKEINQFKSQYIGANVTYSDCPIILKKV